MNSFFYKLSWTLWLLAATERSLPDGGRLLSLCAWVLRQQRYGVPVWSIWDCHAEEWTSSTSNSKAPIENGRSQGVEDGRSKGIEETLFPFPGRDLQGRGTLGRVEATPSLRPHLILPVCTFILTLHLCRRSQIRILMSKWCPKPGMLYSYSNKLLLRIHSWGYSKQKATPKSNLLSKRQFNC